MTTLHRSGVLHPDRDPRPLGRRRQPGPRRMDTDRTRRQTLARSPL